MRALGPLGSDITAPARHANAAILFMRDRYRARPQTSEYLGPCTCPAWEGRGEQARVIKGRFEAKLGTVPAVENGQNYCVENGGTSWFRAEACYSRSML